MKLFAILTTIFGVFHLISTSSIGRIVEIIPQLDEKDGKNVMLSVEEKKSQQPGKNI